MIRMLQHGCLPSCCQIWTDMFQQASEVDMDDTLHKTVCTHAYTHTDLPMSPASLSRQANASRHTQQLSRAEKWKNVLPGGDAVSHTAVRNHQLSVRLETRGQKATVFLLNFQSFVNSKSRVNGLLSFSVLLEIMLLDSFIQSSKSHFSVHDAWVWLF